MILTLMHILLGCVIGLLFILMTGFVFDLLLFIKLERCTCGPDGKCEICSSGRKWRIVIRL